MHRSELCDLKSKYRKNPHHPRIGAAYTKLALLYQCTLQEPAKALCYHLMALKVLQGCNNGGLNVAVTLADIGRVQQSLDRHEEALESFRESRRIFDLSVAAGGSKRHFYPAMGAATLDGIQSDSYVARFYLQGS